MVLVGAGGWFSRLEGELASILMGGGRNRAGQGGSGRGVGRGLGDGSRMRRRMATGLLRLRRGRRRVGGGIGMLLLSRHFGEGDGGVFAAFCCYRRPISGIVVLW